MKYADDRNYEGLLSELSKHIPEKFAKELSDRRN